MSKKILAAIILFLLVSISLFVVYVKLQSVPLDKVSLTIKDIGEDYEEFDKEYITEPYIAPDGTLFAGWKILEKYHVRFSKINETGVTNDSCFIVIDIGRLESENKCKEFIAKIKNTTFYGFDFTELKSETIGEESYIGENIKTDSEVNNYFIVFRIENIIVAMVTSGQTLETSIDYAKIMEHKILNS